MKYDHLNLLFFICIYTKRKKTNEILNIYIFWILKSKYPDILVILKHSASFQTKLRYLSFFNKYIFNTNGRYIKMRKIFFLCVDISSLIIYKYMTYNLQKRNQIRIKNTNKSQVQTFHICPHNFIQQIQKPFHI